MPNSSKSIKPAITITLIPDWVWVPQQEMASPSLDQLTPDQQVILNQLLLALEEIE